MTTYKLATSYSAAKAQYYQLYEDGIANGDFAPLLYPWFTLSFAVVILYLLIPHGNRPLLRSCRYLVWAFNTGYCIYYIYHTRMRLTYGYGGFMLAWAIYWTSVLLLVHDPQAEFKRLEYGPEHTHDQEVDSNQGLAPADARIRFKDRYKLVPFNSTSGSQRLLWVIDLYTQFRGVGWNWQLRSLPKPPYEVQAAVGEEEPKSLSQSSLFGHDGTRRWGSLGQCLRRGLYYFCTRYIAVDAVKVVTVLDPYFWGIIDSPGPDFLPTYIRESPILLKGFRQLVMFCAVRFALELIFSLGPLVFVGLLGPRRVGIYGEYWMYPTVWGSLSYVFSGSLKNFWGGYWHQTFRYAFESISKSLTGVLLPSLSRKSLASIFVQSTFAFALSGCLHAAGSYLQFGPTSPIGGPLAFFLLQPIGVVVQIVGTKLLMKIKLKDQLLKIRVPESLLSAATKAVNYGFTHLWLYLTVPLLLDDFAIGGLACIELLPFSVLGAMGLGGPERGFWCWSGQWFRWHQGEHWWETGIAL